jgi:iron only hydrogenase large subunit-like protein
MEAALRTVSEVATGEELANLDFKAVRGLEGVKETSITILDKTYNVAVTSGLGSTRKLIDEVLSGKKNYHFIEIMACPGGCIGGGGQPILNNKIDRLERIRERAESLYALDRQTILRKSHQNPAVVQLYKEYLEEPLGHRSHQLLHTTYQPRLACVPAEAKS